MTFSTTSIVFNVLHARATPVARLVAAIPPLTLVLSFELLMRQLREQLAESSAAAAMNEAVAIAAAAARHSTTPLMRPTPATAATRRGLLAKAREIYNQHLRDATKLTGRTLGDTLGVSDGYARRLLREIAATQTSA